MGRRLSASSGGGVVYSSVALSTKDVVESDSVVSLGVLSADINCSR